MNLLPVVRRNPDGRGFWLPFWENYRNSFPDPDPMFHDMAEALEKDWGAKIVITPDEIALPCLEFTNPCNISAFLLRWS